MTPALQPQQEYIITNKEVDILQRNLSIPTTRILDDIRSRTHTSPQAPDEPDGMKGYPQEMRAWAEACNIGAEEQYIREQRKEAAKAERERVLKEVYDAMISSQEIRGDCMRDAIRVIRVLESLRPQQGGVSKV